MHIFRENTEDIYAGIEWEQGTSEAQKFYAFLRDEMGVKKVRFPRNFFVRSKACISRRHETSGACSYLVRIAAQIAFGYTGTQGKYYEIYRRRIQALGV